MPDANSETAPRSRAFSICAFAALVVVALLALAAVIFIAPQEKPRAALIGGPFALKDGDGKTVSDETLKGRPSLVYFGYTHCPDVCPTELARIQTSRQTGNRPFPSCHHRRPGARHAKVMRRRVELQPGHPRALRQLAGRGSHGKDLSGLFPQRPAAAGRRISIDHSSVVYLMDKNGAFVEAFNVERPPEDAAKDLECISGRASNEP